MRPSGRLLLVLLALAAAVAGLWFFWPAPQPASVAPPASQARPGDPLAGISGLQITYYDVSGQSVREIREALNRVRPRDPNDGQPVDALAHWRIDWRWPTGPSGGCDLSRVRVTFRADILMPRLAPGAATPAPVAARWRAYAAALERHEAGHVRAAYDQVNAVRAAVRTSDCANANRAAGAVLDAAQRGDIAYDRETRHGATQGARFE